MRTGCFAWMPRTCWLPALGIRGSETNRRTAPQTCCQSMPDGAPRQSGAGRIHSELPQPFRNRLYQRRIDALRRRLLIDLRTGRLLKPDEQPLLRAILAEVDQARGFVLGEV